MEDGKSQCLHQPWPGSARCSHAGSYGDQTYLRMPPECIEIGIVPLQCGRSRTRTTTRPFCPSKTRSMPCPVEVRQREGDTVSPMCCVGTAAVASLPGSDVACSICKASGRQVAGQG
jgi:hypothetical protein